MHIRLVSSGAASKPEAHSGRGVQAYRVLKVHAGNHHATKQSCKATRASIAHMLLAEKPHLSHRSCCCCCCC
jgi:hypothetical protein